MFTNADFEDTPPELRWTTIALEPNTEVTGWLAALPWKLWLHHVGADKPCVFRLTQGRLKCPFCPLPMRGKWYVPFVEKPKNKHTVVLIPKTGAKGIHTFAVGMQLAARRAKGETSPSRLYAEPLAHENLDDTGKRIARANMDIRRYLLHLWQIRALSAFYGEPFRPSVKTTELEMTVQEADMDTLPFGSGEMLDKANPAS